MKDYDNLDFSSLRIALVGRPNVGKSSLFNRITGKKLAIVDSRPGVTRDVKIANGLIGKTAFTVMDTAGFEKEEQSILAERLWQSTKYAIDNADIVLFMISAQDGITALDLEFAERIRSNNSSRVIVCINKYEKAEYFGIIGEAYSLGFKHVVSISTIQNIGFQELEEVIVEVSAGIENSKQEEDKPFLQLAIVGRPNAGKSTLVNSLIKEDRLVTGEEAGITRDSITIPLTYKEKKINIIDTAGLRRQAKVQDNIEKLATKDTFRAIQYAQVVALLIDTTLGLDKQDLTIARKVIDEGRCLILVLNKWDSIEDGTKIIKDIKYKLETSLAQVKELPYVMVSGLYSKGLNKLLDKCFEVYEKWDSRITTSKLNQFLEHIVTRYPPPIVNGRRINIKYITQAKKHPPTFVLNMNRGDALPESYYRYIRNELCKSFNLYGIPIRLIHKSDTNPFV